MDGLMIDCVSQPRDKTVWTKESDEPLIADQRTPVFPDYRERIKKHWRYSGCVKNLYLGDCSLRTIAESDSLDWDSKPVWFDRITVDVLQEWLDSKVGWVWEFYTRSSTISLETKLARQEPVKIVSFRFVKRCFAGSDAEISVYGSTGETFPVFVAHDNVSDTFRFSREKTTGIGVQQG